MSSAMSTAVDTSYVVACVQVDPVIGDVAGNLAVIERQIRQAVDGGAALVVLPEACSTGYMFADRDEALPHSEDVATGPTGTSWQTLAGELDVWIAGGLVERDGDALYNSAILVGPRGVASRYRKVHLWNDEKTIYSPGDLGFPVVATPLGRIGLIICYDAWFPESFRSTSLAGADLVCAPSDWVPVPGQPSGPAMANLMCMTGAHSNQLYVAAASRVGVERGQPFIGSSVVVDHTGWLLAGPGDPAGPDIVAARIDPLGTRSERRTNPFNQPVADRRPDSYRTTRGEEHP